MKFTEDKSDRLDTELGDGVMQELSQEAFLDASVMLDELLVPRSQSDVERIILQKESPAGTCEVAVTRDGEKLVSHFEFIKMVNVQAETVLRYLREGKLVPDMVEGKTKYYFLVSSIRAYARQYGWKLIADEHLKQLFYEVLSGKRMSYSYKPVLVKAMLECAEPVEGKCQMNDILRYFRAFYTGRRVRGMFVEKEKSIFSQPNYSDRDAKRIILIYPYKRFSDMQLMNYIKDQDVIAFHPHLWNGFSQDEKMGIRKICDKALDHYYARALI